MIRLNTDKGRDYNKRLFNGGIREFLHLSRFRWFNSELERLGCPAKRVLELGCFDGKLLEYLPNPPESYVGIDANWEGGLDCAKEKYSGAGHLSFIQAKSANDVKLPANLKFDVAVSLETLEHISPSEVGAYLSMTAKHLDGYLFVSVPNEKGIVFFAKWICKWLIGASPDEYSRSEFWNATIGRMDLVARREHKGFDYDDLIAEIGEYFDVISIVGLPFRFAPKSLSFGVGILARSRPS